MYFIYDLIGKIILLLSPIIFFYRVFTGKEDVKRYKEKYCFYSNNFNYKDTIWFHGSSVGEILSIIPLIKNLEKKKNIKRILITSATLSSSIIFSKYNFKKTTHKYFPLDVNFISKKFINYWKPKIAIFVESEIWPNMIKNLNLKKIPIILINARITKKSFNRWSYFRRFANDNFGKISLAMPQNHETSKYLKKLGVKNIKNFGNLKYFGHSKENSDKKTKKLFQNRLIFCAASTHYNEELLIGKIHKELKLKYKNLLTIIIPRHANRTESICKELGNIDLKIITRSSNKKILKNTDIYIVDTYGETSKFYGLSNITFLGGSLVPHGGQNPLEPARMGSYILHGPNVQNFKEIYFLLSKFNVSSKINNNISMKKIIVRKIKYKQPPKVSKKLNFMGKEILKKNLNEINKYI